MEADPSQTVIPSFAVFRSPGGSFASRVEGPVCRLYDREDLPWPCCSLTWRGKAPSWNRVGRRFVPDVGAQRSPSYAVTRGGLSGMGDPVIWQEVQTLPVRLSAELARWWYSRRIPCGTWPELPTDCTPTPTPNPSASPDPSTIAHKAPQPAMSYKDTPSASEAPCRGTQRPVTPNHRGNDCRPLLERVHEAVARRQALDARFSPLSTQERYVM
jgi:hypothetical protein